MTKTLYLHAETPLARQFGSKDGRTLWVPRSVCRNLMKFPPVEGKLRLCQVEIEDWWWDRNGFEARERKSGQQKLF